MQTAPAQTSNAHPLDLDQAGGGLLVARLDSIARLADEERAALLALPVQVAEVEAGQDLVREGERPSRCALLLDGLACTYKITGGGRRQIMAFWLPGDLPDLQSLHLPVLDNSIATVSRCRVGLIAHGALRALCERHPRLAAALWRETLIDASVSREWVMNVGRREAYRRVAHLLCEMVVRLRAVGLARDYACDLPLTQGVLADAVGLSIVHLNRVLQRLRVDRLITFDGAVLTVPNWERLRSVADFDPAYLHLSDDGVAA